MPFLPNPEIDDAAVISAMQALRATSPQRFCRESELPPEIRAELPELVDRGLIREGAPGTNYLYRAAAASRADQRRSFPWRRLVISLIVWLILVLAPIVVIHLSDPQ